MNKITKEDIIKINELFLKTGVKAQVAREMGISASTVSKYIIPDYKPAAALVIKKYEGDLPEFDKKKFRIDNWTPLLKLSSEEKEEMKELWEELLL